MAASRASPAQIAKAKRWLAYEAADARSEDPAQAAMRVYEKLRLELDPLLGAMGVRMLFIRSAKLAHADYAFLDAALAEDATKLRDCLQPGDPAAAADASAALFGTLLSLITIFIGERLTTEALRRAWPTIDDTEPAESDT
jgi:hypothetical protein